MRFSISIAALASSALMLGACSKAEEAPASEASEEAANADAAPVAVDGGPIPGDYLITSSDGTTQKVTLTEDGKAIYTLEDGSTSTGTYTGGTADEPYCVSGEGGAEPYCSSQSMVDGVWKATPLDDPEFSATITRVTDE